MDPSPKVRKSESDAILRSLAAGVTPSAGLHHLAVGRAAEVGALLSELESCAGGRGGMKVLSGSYGSGKTFLLNLVAYLAMRRGFVVCRADLHPDRSLAGSGRGLALYRALMQGMATRTEPEGGALPRVVERWVASGGALPAEFSALPLGHDFAQALAAARGGAPGAALRWLSGNCSTRREAKVDLGVSSIPTDDWYPYVQLWADFARAAGYQGLLVALDEADMLLRISNAVLRTRNYDWVLGALNDALQGRLRGAYLLLAGTPDFVADRRRGLYSSEALRSRLQPVRLGAAPLDVAGGLAKAEYPQGLGGGPAQTDFSQPLMGVVPLPPEELVVLLCRVRDIHATHHGYAATITDLEVTRYVEAYLSRPGTTEFGTVREVLRGFVGELGARPGTTLGEISVAPGTGSPEGFDVWQP